MAKDREGKFHPKKGSPSDDSKETMDPLPESAHVLHPNRNTQKKREQRVPKLEDKQTTAAAGDETPLTSPQISAQELPYRIDRTGLLSLEKQAAGVCVSIYMPVHKEGQEVNNLDDPIAFKDCLREAEQRLQQENYGVKNIQRMLQPAYDLISDDSFWRDQLQGLAFFAAEGFCRYIRLPEVPEKEILVNDHFLLTPLIPFLTNNEHFFVLTISKHQAKLFRGDRFGMAPVPVPGMPRGITDVVHFEEKDEAGVFRAGGGGAGTGNVNFHGIGGGKPDEKESIALYFAEVARTIGKEVLAEEHAPLMLAGVEYLHPIYSSVSHYKPLIEDGLKGNYEQVTLPELHRQSREKLQPILDAETQRWIDEYNNKSGGPLTSPIPAVIIPAAYFAQAGRLFIQKDAHIWGHFDPQSQQLDIHDEKQPGDDCLVNEAAMQVLLHGGYVHILPKDRMPGGTVMAALFRYP
jgi:hypothetical protein